MSSNPKTIRNYMDEFILYKQSLGYIYTEQSAMVRKYVTFMEEMYPGGWPDRISTEQYLSTMKDTPGVQYGVSCAMREFSRYLHKFGVDAYIIPPKTTHQPTPEPPYFFTEDEIEAFFVAADAITPNRSYPGRELTIPALFRLMNCCGIRCIEARRLKRCHVSTDKRHIDILHSKGANDRRLYISEELARYLDAYDQKIALVKPEREYFFPGFNTPRLSESFICGNFRRCWYTAYPDFRNDIVPTAYDFRHHFAWANINRWAINGLDVNAMLPYLSKYMGHTSISQTLYYFHFVPEFYSTYREMVGVSEDVIPEVDE